MEEIEYKWKEETMRLIDMVNKLKDDNKRLQELVINAKSNLQNQQGGVSIDTLFELSNVSL